MSDLVTQIMGVQSRMETDRAVFETHWQEVAERVWPDRATFQGKRPDGDKRNEKIFDATAALALTRFASAMESMLTPRTTRWHKLRVPGYDIENDSDMRLYLEQVTDVMFDTRYGPRTNFASQMNECYMSIGAFGSCVLLVEDVPGYGIRYRAIHLAECYFMENAGGQIDYMHRKFEMSAKAATERFHPGLIPDKITAVLEKNPSQKFSFLHCVRPAQVSGRFPFESFYVCVDSKTVVEESGFYSFPYAVGRYITTPGETYGRGPAMLVLPDIKMVQEMSKTFLRAAHLAVQPPIMLQEDGVLQAFDLRPGALNFGGLDAQGNQLAVPFQTGAKLDVGEGVLEERRKVINDAFLITLFQILVDKPYMTASEALLRAQEKGQLLAPTMGRFQSETLGPMIEREIDILSRARKLPEPPYSNVTIDIEYVSPLNKMMKADEAVGIMRTLETMTPLAQIDGTILRSVHPDRCLHILAEANGAPERMFRTADELADKELADAQQEQTAQLLAAAPVVTQSIKTMADANKTAAEAPPFMPQPVAAGV